MARDLTAGMVTEVTAAVVRPVVFFEGEFADGFVRLWSGVGDKSWDGNTWNGAGQLLGVSPIEETEEIRASGVQVSLSGIPSALISEALGQARHGLPGKVWLGATDASGAIVADPYQAFVGRLDVPEIVDGGEEATISIAYESRLVDLFRARARRYTHEDQKLVLAADRGFEYVPSLQELTLIWYKP